MRKKYTHIFFDLDNTLWDFETNSENAMKLAYAKFICDGSHFSNFFETYSEINHRLWDLYRKNGITKKELTRKRFEETFVKLGITGVDADDMNLYYLEIMPDQIRLNKGVTELLDYLRNKSYKLAIITNGFVEVQRKKIITSGMNQYFAGVFISEEVKSPKPEREIFEHAVMSMNARKSQSLMIGDDWDVDILGALSFGMDAVYFRKELNLELEMIHNPVNSKNLVFQTGKIESIKSIL